MVYSYTQVNRLKVTEKYMYTEFQGTSFLDAYIQDRINYRDFLQKATEFVPYTECIEQVKEFFNIYGSSKLGKSIENTIVTLPASVLSKVESIRNLGLYRDNDTVLTESLLLSLSLAILTEEENGLVEFWLNKLVQRFEVTKKLYSKYGPNLRKGEGDSLRLELYWLLSLILSLYYLKTKHIQYLSTLLKLNDLLLSVDDTEGDLILSKPLKLAVLNIELDGVQSLMVTKGIQSDEY